MSCKIIASTIHKGGTGKTTIAVHLAHHLGGLGKKVLMVDCDTQANASHVFSAEPLDAGGASQLFVKGGTPEIIETFADNVMLLPADPNLTEIDSLNKGAEKHFRKNLRMIVEDGGYDYAVIDTPPTLLMGMLAPLCVADFAFSPFKPDPFGFTGVKSLLKRIGQIREVYNPDLAYLGLLINLWNRRNRDQLGIIDALRGDPTTAKYVIPQAIGDRAAIARVAYERLPVWAHRSGSAGVAAREMRAAMRWITTQMEKAR